MKFSKPSARKKPTTLKCKTTDYRRLPHLKFKSIKGTRDVLPADIHAWHGVEDTVRSVMRAFNYKEIRTPVFEETGLFARSIGELTDIVGKEMYTFTDRSGTSVTLKPEMTASVLRAYIQNNLGEQQSLVKVYYIAPMFRQERPQAGRLRQFHQFGAEAIGGSQPAIDAEIIALSYEIYRACGVSNVNLRINSVGCGVCRPEYKARLREFLTSHAGSLSEESLKRLDQNPMRVLDSKDERDILATGSAPLILDHLCSECSAHFERLQSSLKAIEVPFGIDGRIVRGLDYYTRTAYEIVSTDLGSQDALAGGGRYDLLAGELGGKDTPAVGFAAGVERLLMVLERQQVALSKPAAPDVFLVSADEAGKAWVFSAAMRLRRAGIDCEIDYLDRSMKAQMREANRQMCRYVAVVGEREIQEQQIALKEMSSGEQRAAVAFSDLANALKKEIR